MPNGLISSPPTRRAVDDGAAVSRPWAGWFGQAFRLLFAMGQSGTTANRPTEGLWPGRPYFDTTLGMPIWVNASGTGWVKADGTAA